MRIIEFVHTTSGPLHTVTTADRVNNSPECITGTEDATHISSLPWPSDGHIEGYQFVDDLPFPVNNDGIVDSNTFRSFQSGLELLLILMRWSPLLLFSRGQMRVIHGLVKYVREHPLDYFPALDDIETKVDARIPQSILPVVNSTDIVPPGQDLPAPFFHISIPSLVRLVCGHPEFSGLLKWLPNIHSENGIDNIRQGSKWHREARAQAINIRLQSGQLLWLRDFHNVVTEDGSVHIMFITQFIERGIGELLVRGLLCSTSDHGVSYFVNHTEEHVSTADNIGMKQVPFLQHQDGTYPSISAGSGEFLLVGSCSSAVVEGPQAIQTAVLSWELLPPETLHERYVADHAMRNIIGDLRHCVVPWKQGRLGFLFKAHFKVLICNADFYSDEFSGTDGKRASYYENNSVQLVGLPYSVNSRLQNEFLVGISARPTGPLQMMAAVLDTSGQEMNRGFVTWHEALSEMVYVTGYLHMGSVDNPRGNEFSSTTGSGPSLCRNCDIIVAKAWEAGTPRTLFQMKSLIAEVSMVVVLFYLQIIFGELPVGFVEGTGDPGYTPFTSKPNKATSSKNWWKDRKDGCQTTLEEGRAQGHSGEECRIA